MAFASGGGSRLTHTRLTRWQESGPQGGNSDHGRDEADVVLTPGLSQEETDATALRDGQESMWTVPLSSVTDFLTLGAQIITKE